LGWENGLVNGWDTRLFSAISNFNGKITCLKVSFLQGISSFSDDVFLVTSSWQHQPKDRVVQGHTDVVIMVAIWR
jgi:hypothetical protein